MESKKKMVQMNLFIKKIESQSYGYQGGGGGGINWETVIDMGTQLK